MREAVFKKQNIDKWQLFEQDTLTSDPDVLSERFIQLTDDLSYSRTFYPESPTTSYLNGLTGKFFGKIYANKPEKANRFILFWKEELPFLLYSYQKELLFSYYLPLATYYLPRCTRAPANPHNAHENVAPIFLRHCPTCRHACPSRGSATVTRPVQNFQHASSFKASVNRATSATMCAADKVMRRRAVPCGTVGGRIAATQMPRSRSCALKFSAA